MTNSSRQTTQGPPTFTSVTDDIHLAAATMVQEELMRWAAEIHDGLTQTVAASILELEVLGTVMDRDPAAAKEMLNESVGQLRGAMADVREVLFHLTDGSPRTTDLLATVAIAQERWAVAAEVKTHGPLDELTPQVAEAACLVLREALANAATHARATAIDVVIDVEDDTATVQVADHGSSAQAESRDRHHFGMRLMERQVQLVGGTLVVERPEEGGLQLTATFTRRRVR